MQGGWQQRNPESKQRPPLPPGYLSAVAGMSVVFSCVLAEFILHAHIHKQYMNIMGQINIHIRILN